MPDFIYETFEILQTCDSQTLAITTTGRRAVAPAGFELLNNNLDVEAA